ncbi:MAG: hypothetical protein CVT61_00220 [Actinobacteria bacterium HGW-Actinobacteria-11]|nr:MAG: hypothetical protein CVT61_00220 [Actinobacteria bacterium HGW-Actinobacteria-11]
MIPNVTVHAQRADRVRAEQRLAAGAAPARPVQASAAPEPKPAPPAAVAQPTVATEDRLYAAAWGPEAALAAMATKARELARTSDLTDDELYATAFGADQEGA